MKVLTSDGFTVDLDDELVVARCATLHNVATDITDATNADADAVPLPMVTKRDLDQISDFLVRNTPFAPTTPGKDLARLCEVADYLASDTVLDALSNVFADFILKSSVEQIREALDVVNDFTRDEEELVRLETSWAFA